MTAARIDYVELPSATAHELTRAFYAKAFGWEFTNYGPTYSATTNGTTDVGLAGRSGRRALGAASGDPRRRSRGGVRRCGQRPAASIAKPIFSFPGGRRFHFIDPSGSELAVWSEARRRLSPGMHAHLRRSRRIVSSRGFTSRGMR